MLKILLYIKICINQILQKLIGLSTIALLTVITLPTIALFMFDVLLFG